MAEAVASAPSAGAGRLIDMSWPSNRFFRQNGGGPPNTVFDRLGGVDVQGSAPANLGNQNNGFNANINGRSGATFGATAGGFPNGVKVALEPMVISIGRRASSFSGNPPSMAGLDQYGAYRVMMIATFVNPAAPLAANIDNGLQICCAGALTLDDGEILRRGTPGLGINVDHNVVNAIIVGTQNAAPLIVPLLTLAGNGYDCRDWHCYEIRVIGALGSLEAQAKWFIDGQLLFAKSWDNVNSMPETNANVSGFKVIPAMNAGLLGGFTVDQINFHGSTDELNLL